MSSDSSLAVPLGEARPGTSSTSPSSSVQHLPERVDEHQDVNTIVKPGVSPAPNSTAEMGAGGTGEERPMGLKLPAFKAASAGDLRSGLASPVIPDGAVKSLIATIHAESPGAKTPTAGDLPMTVLYAGSTHKKFKAYNYLLTTKVPYFNKLLSATPGPSPEQLTFGDFNEFAFAIFIRWLYGGLLHGPTDFHSVQHYLCLYVMGQKWDCEALCNDVIDTVRAYYRANNMTAPTFRIEYVYTFTEFPNHMRRFLTETAAYRALCGEPPAKGVFLSDSMKGFLKKGGDFSIDYAHAAVRLTREQFPDPRKGAKCDWHEHSNGEKCLAQDWEPYMSL